MRILTTSQMCRVEEECAKIGLPPSMLMENAGKAVAEEVRKILSTINLGFPKPGLFNPPGAVGEVLQR